MGVTGHELHSQSHLPVTYVLRAVQTMETCFKEDVWRCVETAERLPGCHGAQKRLTANTTRLKKCADEAVQSGEVCFDSHVGCCVETAERRPGCHGIRKRLVANATCLFLKMY